MHELKVSQQRQVKNFYDLTGLDADTSYTSKRPDKVYHLDDLPQPLPDYRADQHNTMQPGDIEATQTIPKIAKLMYKCIPSEQDNRRDSKWDRMAARSDEIETQYLDNLDQMVGVFCKALLAEDIEVSFDEVLTTWLS